MKKNIANDINKLHWFPDLNLKDSPITDDL